MTQTNDDRDNRWYLKLMAPRTRGEKFAWLDPSAAYVNAKSFHAMLDDLSEPFGEGEIEHEQEQEIPHPPIAMRILGKARCFGATEFARPIHDVLNTEQEQQRRCFDQDHPKIAQARQGIDPHLGNQYAPK